MLHEQMIYDSKDILENVLYLVRGGPRAAATSKMERFAIIVNALSAPSWMLQQP